MESLGRFLSAKLPFKSQVYQQEENLLPRPELVAPSSKSSQSLFCIGHGIYNIFPRASTPNPVGELRSRQGTSNQQGRSLFLLVQTNPCLGVRRLSLAGPGFVSPRPPMPEFVSPRKTAPPPHPSLCVLFSRGKNTPMPGPARVFDKKEHTPARPQPEFVSLEECTLAPGPGLIR